MIWHHFTPFQKTGHVKPSQVIKQSINLMDQNKRETVRSSTRRYLEQTRLKVFALFSDSSRHTFVIFSAWQKKKNLHQMQINEKSTLNATQLTLTYGFIRIIVFLIARQ